MVQRLSGRIICIQGVIMIRINQLKLPISHSREDLLKKAAKTLKISTSQIEDMTIIRQSLDARKKQELLFVYSIDCKVKQEKQILRKVNNNNVIPSQNNTLSALNNNFLVVNSSPLISSIS